MKAVSILLILLTAAASAFETAKPWTRWWWLGSAVDEQGITAQLEDFAEAGLGGVEICPIYGAKGAEDRFLDFLSPEWTAMLAHTAKECERLGLGLDLTTGTGWPFGGPWVTDEMASRSLVPLKWGKVGKGFQREFDSMPDALKAFSKGKEPIDLLPLIKDGKLDWTAPEGEWSIYGISSKSPIQKVKRAAPGGAGNVLDPFSADSLAAYLAKFDEPLKSLEHQPRAHFHDSFEYYGADWTPEFLEVFKSKHGYEFSDRLPAFFASDDSWERRQIHHDYRATLDELHLAYLKRWNDWAKAHGSLTRNQAHGSPGNLLDHYAVADIPETEIFRHVDNEQIPMLQFAASAAHLTGKNLVSAESFTWLGEHFQVTPEKLKEAADFLWLGGVNHLFFHGIPYSPEDAGWPGWLFYASTHMGQNGGLWHDLPAFNNYIETVQRELQAGEPDTAVLLYFPVDDCWVKPADKLPLFTIHNQNEWLHGTPFHWTAMAMWQNGIPCDFVSQRLLEKAIVVDGKIVLGGRSFDVLFFPESTFGNSALHPLATKLSDEGAEIVSLAGFPDHESDQAPLISALADRGIVPEPMAAKGIRFARRVTEEGHSWFLVNKSETVIDEWIDLATPFESAIFIDPKNPENTGLARTRGKSVRFHLLPGESRIMRTSNKPAPQMRPWFDLFGRNESATALSGSWKIEFIEGGLELPAALETDSLKSWTEFADDPAYRNFSGTARYTTTFESERRGPFILDLGEVAETCRVSLNGRLVGTSFFPPHRFNLFGFLKPGENTLAIEVTNLAANRIAELDRQKAPWKNFHEINFVNIDYKPFDASGWKPLPSGLLGPVNLIRPDMEQFRRRWQDPERVHDPSTIFKEGDDYFLVSTGRGIPVVKEQPDGKWTHVGRIFGDDDFPAWHLELVPGNNRDQWAPDVIKLGDTYYLYYSVSTFGEQTSAIGLVTGKTLNPESPDWGWTDHGPIITSTPQKPFNAIDPAMFQDDDGSLWMVWGSYWEGLFLAQLDPDSGKLLDDSKEPVRLATARQIEAAFVHKRDGYYYLFLNWGSCCQGVNSTYNIRVGRSKSINGPYLDKEGIDLKNGGGSLVMDSEGDHIGPGHASILVRDGKEWLAHHFYNGAERGAARLALAPLSWDAEGWPEISE